ncbi:MAG: hypothetical protein J6Y82_12545 [Bacteroidales bacterium]|nr:hypothetical protein [Bacteroidales bacterium]
MLRRKLSILFIVLCGFTSLRAQIDSTEINRETDGVREGFWRIEGINGKVEEGNYAAGKKVGIWKTTKNGIIQSEVTFTDGQAIGEATIYFPDGTLMEKGYWNIDHWEGGYDRYHENGKKACQFTYDKRGRREGRQLYFHENGKVLYDGEWKGGKIVGTLSMFNDQGQKVLERNYSESGKFEGATEIQVSAAKANVSAEFTGTGNFTLYNLKGKVERKGYFRQGKLIDGEMYIYNASGTLQRTDVYKNGELKSSK